jgi:Pyruvate/2-oxoacid:ferredoxin oxidoreductase delta subunit
MADVYQQLARRLDTLPHGFPATDSGVELKILRKIFTPADAEMALNLRPVPETAAGIAQRLGRPEDEMRAILDRMARQGQIGCFKVSGRPAYVLMPFVVGIFEFQLNRMDAELARLCAEYEPQLMRTVGGAEPALARVVPVNLSIRADHQVLRYEDTLGIVEQARSFVLRECICRKQRALEGHSCAHALETCIGFSPEDAAFDYFTHAGRVISKDDALAVLEASAREGLVHCTYNVQHGHRWICNCCTCCCGLLRGLTVHQAPHLVVGSDLVAAINTDTCSACGLCAQERCPMEAIAADNGAYRVLAERCIGCGVCTITCPTESITLQRRPQRQTPPANLMAWATARTASRGLDPAR